MRIDIIADLICPWCLVGKRRLERALRAHAGPVEIAWRPFLLNPDMPRPAMPREHFARLNHGPTRNAERGDANLVAIGKALGIDFAFDRIRRVPNTVDAHRLIRLAAAEGCAELVVGELFLAYFSRGRDIGEIGVLASIAADCGLASRAARNYLAGERDRAEVLAEARRARQIGVSAVPCFIFDGEYAVAGAQEPEIFLPLFELCAVGGGLAAAAD